MKYAKTIQSRVGQLAAVGLLALSTITAQAGTATIDVLPQADAQMRTQAAIETCVQCGMVESVRELKQSGEGTGVGTVAGGLLGGLLGRQLSDGGSTLGMLFGMIGGAYAGNKFEQQRNQVTRYEVMMRMDDGSQRVLTYDTRPVWQVGERVRLGSRGIERSAEESRPSMADERGGI